MKTLNFVPRPHFSMVSPFSESINVAYSSMHFGLFSEPAPVTIFGRCKVLLSKHLVRFWLLFSFSSVAKWCQNRSDSRSEAQKAVPGKPGPKRPCFHKTIVILCRWNIVSFKRSFFRWICQIFCFCCVSLCSVLYNIFITFFQKTSVNAEPLSPPFFLEIAAHKEIQFFFSFWCLRLRFFYFFIFLLIFGYPLPTPWARFAPFLIDFGAIFGPTFPRLPRWIEAEIKLHLV